MSVLRKSVLVMALVTAGGLGAWQLRAADSGDRGNRQAREEAESAETIREADDVLKASLSGPDQGIPKELLGRAECIGVFPGVKKGAFVIGGEYGHGVFTCRKEDGTMGAPALFTVGGGSIGWQFGGKKVDIVMLIMNKDGVRRLLQDKFKDKFTVGGEVAAVAGPVGRTAQAATDAQMHAEILSWSHARGVFLGAAFKGAVIKPDMPATEALYGEPLTATEILIAEHVTPPEQAKEFIETATESARRSTS
jgi:lipid-binding SYLF domain-containing protein